MSIARCEQCDDLVPFDERDKANKQFDHYRWAYRNAPPVLDMHQCRKTVRPLFRESFEDYTNRCDIARGAK